MIFTAFIGIWVTFGLYLGFAMPPAGGLVATPCAFLHIPMAIAMEFAFLLSAFFGVLWLVKRQTKFDAMSLAFAETGLVFCVIALITGSLWAKVNWNAYWSWDPQQVGIVATLLVYAALFALRGAVEDEGKRRDLSAVYVVFGFIAAYYFTVIFRKLAPATLHPKDIMAGSDHLFKTVLRVNYFGFTLLAIQIARLRARIENAHNSLKEQAWTTSI